ncbi:MAG: class I SAM-dependent methyltransferase [Anaerolineales bacterium]|nr:class I SAM-dependent methyltransferase [Anaerolineales bacterium]
METSEYHNIARLEAGHWWYAGMRALTRAVLARLPLPPAAQILDAGCGVGGGLRWLAEFGTPTGIDWHPVAAGYAAQVSRRVARASVQALPFPEAAFDAVTSFEVLYHLAVADDVAALREFARVLRPGGWLVVRVPAHDWLRGAHDRLVHTRHRYEAQELRAKLTRAGLRVRRVTPAGALLLPPAILRRALQRSSEAHTDVALPPPLINRLLTAALAAEGRWLGWADLPFGLSLLAVAQKAGRET